MWARRWRVELFSGKPTTRKPTARLTSGLRVELFVSSTIAQSQFTPWHSIDAARQNIFSAPDCDDGNGFKFAARFVVDGIRSRVRIVGRPHARALARADTRPARRPRVAALASARRRLSPRRAGRAWSPNLAQAPRHRARRVCRIAMLSRAVFAAAHARCSHGRFGLPALQRNSRAVR